MAHVVELDVAGRILRLETGRVAKQADGSVWASYGDTVVLATAVASQNAKPGVDFLPLTVDYQEKAYAAGKIPGGYFKREGRPSEKEVLTSRLIDRPLRPLFPEGYYFETQVIASVLSSDRTGSSDVIGITAASAALAVSNIPFLGPIAGIKIGRVNGQFVVNPDLETLKSSELDLVVAGTGDAVMMVEAGANELPEATMLQAIELAHAEIKKIVAKINELRALSGNKPKRVVATEEIAPELTRQVKALVAQGIRDAIMSKPTTLQGRVIVLDPYDEAVWINIAVFGGNAESGLYWQKVHPGKNVKFYADKGAWEELKKMGRVHGGNNKITETNRPTPNPAKMGL